MTARRLFARLVVFAATFTVLYVAAALLGLLDTLTNALQPVAADHVRTPRHCTEAGNLSGATNILIRAALLGTIGVLAAASPALADANPYVGSAPSISGTATVGNTLSAVGGVAGGTGITK